MNSKETPVRDSFLSNGSSCPATEDKDLEARSQASPDQVEKHGAFEHADGIARQTAEDEWNDPSNGLNPMNWSSAKKAFHLYVPSFIGVVTTYASSSYTPGIDQVVDEFHTPIEVARVVYVAYILGLALGGIYGAPLSEKMGRRGVYMVCLPPFALFVLGTGFSRNVASLIITRIFAGFFGSTPLSVGPGTVGDLYAPRHRALPMALNVAAPFLGPTLGPVIGGYVTETVGWRWTQWTVLFFFIVAIVPVVFTSETFAKKIRREHGLSRQKSAEGVSIRREEFVKSMAKFIRTYVGRPIHMLVTEPCCLAFSSYVAFNFALLYSFFTVFPNIFTPQYGFSIGSVGLTFLGVGVGCIVGTVIIVIVDRTLYMPRLDEAEAAGVRIAPEHRLYSAMIGAVLLPPSLFLFGWSAQYKVHWIVPVIGDGIFGCGNLLVFLSATVYLIDFYGPAYGASAVAGMTIARYTLATAVPLFSVQMFAGLGIGWASSLLGFVSLALASVPWCLYFYLGPKLRARSSYQSSA